MTYPGGAYKLLAGTVGLYIFPLRSAYVVPSKCIRDHTSEQDVLAQYEIGPGEREKIPAGAEEPGSEPGPPPERAVWWRQKIWA